MKQIKDASLLPEKAVKFDDTSESLLLVRSLLASSVRWYNDLSKNLTDYETKLIYSPWKEINSLMDQGYSEKWSSDGLLSYAEKVYTTIKMVYENVNQAKENVKVVQAFIEKWSRVPMFERDDPNSLVDFKIYMTPRVKCQIAMVKETSEKMQEVMEDNLELFNSDPSSEEWKNYVSYLESMIENGLTSAVKCSLQYLLDNTDKQNDKLIPFYKISMALKDGITFLPPLTINEQGSLIKLFDAVIDKIYSPSSEIKRMIDADSDYSENISSGASCALARAANFQIYSDLWLQNLEESLEDFVLHGPVQETPEGDEFQSSAVETEPPTEEEFRTQISQFDLLQRKVDDIEPVIIVESWLKLDITSFKDTLLIMIRNWSSAYKKKLVELKSLGKLRKLEDDGDV